ncbi:PrsW family intramembrane metalloprotease [Paeniglutamicibacter psychrophenolicus]|uniref:RsiW-degrading membrane proteinase PrsW (M82 family) n=1 Tax=Paeniglutamicibacter psychrophenolicus TaxID=257454 RepID=A0ABS4WFE4_9MICC|nr:PrsW family intramembrane metalloprotease [Paeniglutamicibacter psychrophenolicus]MBP2374853.1 RsiW-degrading membrane proteinase PrsW (M82 family) [Paeniglutamicibacter psychrophenolicus]
MRVTSHPPQSSPHSAPQDPWASAGSPAFPDSPGLPGSAPSPSGPPPGHRRRSGSTAVTLALVACTVVLLGVGFFLAGAFGSGTVLWLGALAMVPLALCLLGLRWVDRWDPEPRALLALGLFWGAGASVAGALLVGDVFMELFFDPAGRLDLDLFGAVVQAPIVEELAKGAGVLLIFWINRSHFDGPIDGIVYGGIVGAGFAFTENILYFASSYVDPGAKGELVSVFVLRGLFSPFVHVMFTAWTGFALGLCAARGKRGRWPLYLVLGLLPAMVGHFLWNGGVGIFFDNFLSFYFVLQVPLFAASIVAVVLLQRGERKLTEQRLDEYRASGWFTAAEVQMFATRAGRRNARRWAAGIGRSRQMKEFTATAMNLAAVRQRIAAGHPTGTDFARELALLHKSHLQRAQLLTLA